MRKNRLMRLMAVAALSVSLVGLGGCAGAQIKGNEGKIAGAVIGAAALNLATGGAAGLAFAGHAAWTAVGAGAGYMAGKAVDKK